MSSALTTITGIALYLLGSGLFLRRQNMFTERVTVLDLIILGVPWLLHGASIYLLGFSDGRLDLSFYDSLSVVAWSIVTLLLVGLTNFPLRPLAVMLMPVAAAVLLLQWRLGPQHQQLIDYGWQIDLHVALGVLAFAVLSVAAVQALLCAFQERSLRRRELTDTMSLLMPVPTMERLLFQLIGLGFALLSLTLLSGVLFVDDLLAQHLAHKTVLSIIGWVVFGVLLLGRWRFGWRGWLAVRLTLAGMALLLLAYFGSKLVLELILERT